MANHAYLRVWPRDFSTETMLAQFARFLTTAPLSAAQNAFTELAVQAVDATEIPVAEWHLRPLKVGPRGRGSGGAAPERGHRIHRQRNMGFVGFRHRKLEMAAQAATAPADLCTARNMMVDLQRCWRAWLIWASSIFHWTRRAPCTRGIRIRSLVGSSHGAHVHGWMTQWKPEEYHARPARTSQLFNWVEALEQALPVKRNELWSKKTLKRGWMPSLLMR
jgi:hypothetical protein